MSFATMKTTAHPAAQDLEQPPPHKKLSDNPACAVCPTQRTAGDRGLRANRSFRIHRSSAITKGLKVTPERSRRLPVRGSSSFYPTGPDNLPPDAAHEPADPGGCR